MLIILPLYNDKAFYVVEFHVLFAIALETIK